jgi:hypothetical protein
VWARKYRSRLGPDTTQGKGWDFSYDVWIEQVGAGVRVHDGLYASRSHTQRADRTYTAPQLFANFRADGSFTLRFADTGTWSFLPLDGALRKEGSEHRRSQRQRARVHTVRRCADASPTRSGATSHRLRREREDRERDRLPRRQVYAYYARAAGARQAPEVGLTPVVTALQRQRFSARQDDGYTY